VQGASEWQFVHFLQVEAHARMTVKEIFEQEGEEAFREVETAVLQVAVVCNSCAHVVLSN
jgi:shikimate kinase